jgi:hypothetical protein
VTVAYRAYMVGEDGHFFNFEPIDATTDQEAIEKAKQFVDGHDIEVWERARFLKRLPRKVSKMK